MLFIAVQCTENVSYAMSSSPDLTLRKPRWSDSLPEAAQALAVVAVFGREDGAAIILKHFFR